MFAVECLGDFVVEFLSVFIRAPPEDEPLGQPAVEFTMFVIDLCGFALRFLACCLGVCACNTPRIGIPVYRHLSFPFIFREVNNGCNCGAYFSGYAKYHVPGVSLADSGLRLFEVLRKGIGRTIVQLWRSE